MPQGGDGQAQGGCDCGAAGWVLVRGTRSRFRLTWGAGSNSDKEPSEAVVAPWSVVPPLSLAKDFFFVREEVAFLMAPVGSGVKEAPRGILIRSPARWQENHQCPPPHFWQRELGRLLVS
jgi:hypothetical protein